MPNTLTKEKLRSILSDLFVPRAKGLEGVCFKDEYMRECSEGYPIYTVVSDVQQESKLSFDFSYNIANRAVDILVNLDDWDDDDISSSADNEVPVYTSELMEIYTSNAWAVDEAILEMGGDQGDSAQRAALGWYQLIYGMVNDIKAGLKDLIDEDHE